MYIPGFLTLAEVAQRLHVSRSMAYRLCHTGKLPFIKVGSLMRVEPGELEAYLERQRQSSASSADPSVRT